MQVKGLDHVNIIAADLDETARFYEDLLGLRYGARPSEMNFPGGWLYDEAGQAIIHVMPFLPDRHGEQERKSMPTGSIDHVALACEGFVAMVKRCEELGVPHRISNRTFGDLRQVFVTDPNNIAIELNFTGD